MSKEIAVLVRDAMQLLKDLGLQEGTLASYVSNAFRPIIRYYDAEGCVEYQENLMQQLKSIYEEQHRNGCISKHVLCWRLRGIYILSEIHATGSFTWKVFSRKKAVTLTAPLEYSVVGFVSTLDLSDKRKRNIETVVRRFVRFIADKGLADYADVTPIQVREFLLHISKDRPKSMDDVVDALRKYCQYLNRKMDIDPSIDMILTAPRSRDHRVKPCMKTDEIIQVILNIDRATPGGKRDYAVMILAATTGLRAGDLANLKLTDVSWKQKELRCIQGKTQELLVLPLQKHVMSALADYILNGRPSTGSAYLFLRNIAPYHAFHDGVSVACIFRKHLRKAGIEHLLNDGRTLHGMRRTLGTKMIASGIPVATIAQVLGHSDINTTKQYISLDVEGLRNCTLSMALLGGADK